MTGLPFLQPTADDATVVVKHEMLEGERVGRYAAVGDSSCMMGIVPDVFEQEIGQGVVNLGTLATFTVAGYSAFGCRLAQSNDRPQAIVFVVLPRAFEVTEQQAKDYGLVGRYSAAYRGEAGTYSVSMPEVARLFFRKHRINRFPAEFGGKYSVFHDRLIRSGGFLPEEGRYVPSGEKRSEFRLSPWAVEQFEELLRVAEQNQVRVLFWFSPRPEEYCTDAYLEQAISAIRPLEEKYSCLHMLQSTVPHWPAERFGSVTHLDVENAELNTRYLARAIQLSEDSHQAD